MKLHLIFLLIVFVFTGCQSDSTEGTKQSDDKITDKKQNSIVLDTVNKEKFTKTEVSTKNRLSNDTKIESQKNISKYQSNNFNTSKSYGLSNKDYSEDELEKKLKEEFENIDPLEYYLQNNPKFTDKKVMFIKKSEINSLLDIYKNKYYDNGHVQEMRENNAVLISLVSNAYPPVLYEKYDSISNKSNESIVKFKNTESKSFESQSINPLNELNRAVQLINEGRNAAAADILNKLLSESLINNYLANYNKAFVSFKLGDNKNAIKYANRSILAKEDFYLGYLLLGEAHLSIGDFNQALKAFQKSLTIKNNIVSIERIAYTQALKGDYLSAFRLYSSIIDSQKDRGERNYKALKAFSRIPIDVKNESLTTAKYLANVDPEWPVPPLIAAYKELYDGNINLSVKHCNKAIELGEHFFSNLGLAIGYYNSKEYAKASDLFLTLNNYKEFDNFKFQKELLLIQIFAHTNNNKDFEAFKKLQDYSFYHKKDDYYYLGMSLISYGKYNFKKAEAYLDSIKNNKIFETDYTYLKGVYALRNDNFNIAKIYFNKSNEKKQNIRALNGLGAIFNKKGDYKSAVEMFEKGLLEEPNNPYLLFNKASSIFLKAKDLYEQNDTVNARQTIEFGCDLLRKAKSIKNYFVIDMNIGNSYLNIHDYNLAIYYNNLLNDNYSNVNAGVAHARMNNLSKAKEIWESIVLIDPDVDLAKFNLNESNNANPTFRSYYYHYYDVSVNIEIPIPILFDKMFEPLVPLGHSSFKFHTLTKD